MTNYKLDPKDHGYDLTPEQLDGMDMWDRDVMLDERHRAVGAMLVRLATAEIRRRRTQPALTADEVRAVVRDAVRVEFTHKHDNDSIQNADWIEIQDAIASRVAEKLAGRAIGPSDEERAVLQLADAWLDDPAKGLGSHREHDLATAVRVLRRSTGLGSNPDFAFDDSDVSCDEVGFSPEDDQSTSPEPMQTMAEIQSDGGERPRVTGRE